MAAPKLDLAAAKARRQKLIAIGGAVVLVALLAVQVPRTLKMLGPATSETAPAAPVAAPEAPVPGDPPAAPAPAAVLVDSDPPVPPAEGQLVAFDRFVTKDPFRQQAEAPAEPEAVATAAPKPAAPKQAAGGAASPSGSVVPSQPAQPAATTPAAGATTIEVNGVAETVATGASFPAADPVFVLAERGAGGTSVRIGVAGGDYSDGRQAVVVNLGKSVTLMNTASGARYALKLIAVGPS